MRIFIPHTHFSVKNKRLFFILTRPFFFENQWVNDAAAKSKWGLQNEDFNLVLAILQAEFVLIPFSINSYFIQNKSHELTSLNEDFKKHHVKDYGTIVDDSGTAFPDFSNIIYFRASGFKSQLSQQNKGFPVILSDHFQLRYKQETIIPRSKKELPSIGFCGHATLSISKRSKEMLIFWRENLKRILQNPFRKDWEPLFAFAYERAKIMKLLEQSSLVTTNFIYRNLYRAGAKTEEDLEKTTQEYFDRIYSSDYVLCIRGAGNFSVRLYETLMFGRIPIFVNTDCILPFEDTIDWKKHVIWVEWKDRKNIAAIVADFHQQLSNEDFIKMQMNNRALWKETLSVTGMLQIIANDI